MSAQLLTDWGSPPGATIMDAINARGLSMDEFACKVGETVARIEQLINGELPINYDMAISLADTIGGSPRFWMQRETTYRIDLQRLATPDTATKREWLAKFPIADMIQFGWIQTSKQVDDRFKACLDFFGVRSIREWETSYSESAPAFAFRSTAAFEENYASTAVWLRYAEQEATKIACSDWDKEKLKAALPQLRHLTKTKLPNTFVPAMRKTLADCGVALVIARTPKGCRASGATCFLSPSKAMVILSFRYRSDDHFWFTLFHELGHLILHDDTHVFLEGSDMPDSLEEREANAFSQEVLIPSSIRQSLHSAARNYKAIIRLAGSLGLPPGILVGQMQHMKIVDNRRLNFLKRRYEWEEIGSLNL